MDSRDGLLHLELNKYADVERGNNGGGGGHVDVKDVLHENMGNGNSNNHSNTTVDQVKEGAVNALNPEITQTKQILSNAASIQAAVGERLVKLSEFLASIPQIPQIEPIPSNLFTGSEKLDSAAAINLQQFKLDVNKLIAEKNWDEAKQLALKSMEKTAPKNSSSVTEALAKMAETNSGDPGSLFDMATPFEKAVLFALGATAGVIALPNAVIEAVGYIATVLTIGPVAEGVTLELLANPAFMQAAGRAGALIGSGKLLNSFGIFEAAVPQRNIAVKHPLTGLTVEQVIQKATATGLKTEKDSLILWSGLGIGKGVKLARDFAEKNGGKTLEMTEGGKWLEGMDLFGMNSPFSPKDALLIWEGVSKNLIKQASGQVRAVTGVISPDSIYNAELREILLNKNITGVDELSIQPRIILR